ncbi:class I SAM-dependent methyltransferase [Oceanobacillus chungangensis]|uniref:Class I SAM-dependent methyltransferase n=1 Tax=Oceanobacillus chungangensis TaxID=1229152 RepID=A0A3D8PMJ7_9BACI|nr:class I SAM-dependent methyltransferase [Oceanobacillus chungangensis]RDW17320.1 class I SAM-dependent methyltransferase [Oceanobacillus chungangensis]
MLGYYSKLSSEVYDIDKYIGLSFGDVEFYSERLASCKGEILEPGVGTGRILIPLLEKDLKVVGFDVSDEMLKICSNNCEKRGLNPRLFKGEMESISLETKYEAIIIPTGTMLLLHRREDSIKALINFYHHISNGGRLILDIFLQTDLLTDKVSTRSWESNSGDIITLESKIVEVDYINQYTISHHRYEKWQNGKLLQTELERFPLRWYGVEEFKMILEQIGFEDIVISSDYNYGQYPNKSSQIITFEAVVNKD